MKGLKHGEDIGEYDELRRCMSSRNSSVSLTKSPKTSLAQLLRAFVQIELDLDARDFALLALFTGELMTDLFATSSNVIGE